MLESKFSSWKEFYKIRQKYCTLDHRPFYDVVAKYLPKDENANIVDIGSGEGDFIEHLQLATKYKNIFLLDRNPLTIERVKNRFKNDVKAIYYKVPDRIPFEDTSINYINCSHLLEHLYPYEFYQLLKEIDRILAVNGILAISMPLLWDGFYGDISHIKPYNPWVILKYLCYEPHDYSQEGISQRYVQLELIFRYTSYNFDDSWGSDYKPFDLILYLLKKILTKLKIRKYQKNGYTIILQKNNKNF